MCAASCSLLLVQALICMPSSCLLPPCCREQLLPVLFAAVLPSTGRRALHRALKRLMVPDGLHNGRIWAQERLQDVRSALYFAAQVCARATRALQHIAPACPAA